MCLLTVLLHTICRKLYVYLVNLCYHSIEHFPFEWSEHYGLVLDGIENKASSWLDAPCTNVVNGCHGNDKAIPNSEHNINVF